MTNESSIEHAAEYNNIANEMRQHLQYLLDAEQHVKILQKKIQGSLFCSIAHSLYQCLRVNVYVMI